MAKGKKKGWLNFTQTFPEKKRKEKKRKTKFSFTFKNSETKVSTPWKAARKLEGVGTVFRSCSKRKTRCHAYIIYSSLRFNTVCSLSLYSLIFIQRKRLKTKEKEKKEKKKEKKRKRTNILITTDSEPCCGPYIYLIIL